MKNTPENTIGYFEIARESSDLPIDEFVNRYYTPEQPVIIENVGTDWPAKELWTEHYIREKLAKEPSSATASLWYWMERGTLDSDYQVPGIIAYLLDFAGTFPRPKSMRIWIHNKNNVSSWHYDTNMVNVFNAQVTGQKKWYLVSPDTPLDCYPFINFAIMDGDDEKNLRKKTHTHFTLNEGDMLYVPPLWFHKVISKGEENISLNWILTKKETTVSSKTLLRELERYQLQERLSKHRIGWVENSFKVINAKIPGYLRSKWRYPTMIKTSQPQRRFGLIRRTLTELSALGKTLWHANKVSLYLNNLKPIKKLDKSL